MSETELSFHICYNTEFLAMFTAYGADILEATDDGDDYDEIMSAFGTHIGNALLERFDNADVGATSGQKATCHGFNGANTYAHKIGPVGTYDKLTGAQEDLVFQALEAARDATIADWS